MGYLEGVVLEDRNRKSSSSSQPTECCAGKRGYLEGVVLEDRNRKSSSSSKPILTWCIGYLRGGVLEAWNRKSSSASQPTELVRGLPGGGGT
jgi:hypothetical protein